VTKSKRSLFPHTSQVVSDVTLNAYVSSCMDFRHKELKVSLDAIHVYRFHHPPAGGKIISGPGVSGRLSARMRLSKMKCNYPSRPVYEIKRAEQNGYSSYSRIVVNPWTNGPYEDLAGSSYQSLSVFQRSSSSD